MKPSTAFISDKLARRSLDGSYRSLKSESTLIDFCSNDYLGFARSATLKQAIDDEMKHYNKIANGSTGSRLLSGNSIYTEDLEKELAAIYHSESSLIFNSGYDANLGLFSSILQKGDTVITDELAHASIIDGTRLSYANRYKFRHNDIQNLEDKLKVAKGNCYVAIESVYSMDGDSPPILEILDLVEKYNADLIVDEAHAVGLYGFGLVDENISSRIFAKIVTFGKALGCHGAVILGSNLLREYLINFARPFIYTTAASFHQVASVKMACNLLKRSSPDIKKLHHNIYLFKQHLTRHEYYPLIKSNSAIQCLLLKSTEKALKFASDLQSEGFDVRPILSPTVPDGCERIRICIHSFNTENEITLLAKTINKLTHAA